MRLVQRLFQRLLFLFSLQHCFRRGVGVYWGVVTTSKGMHERTDRRQNVDRILGLDARIHQFHGNNGFDENCQSLLRSLRIFVDRSRYYDASGGIRSGKLGHWCSFIRFLQKARLEGGGRGVWIEDDVVLTERHVEQIDAILRSKRKYKPIVRLSSYAYGNDGVLIVFDVHKILQPILENGIVNPTDVTYEALDYYDRITPLWVLRRLLSESTITTTETLDISVVNALLQ
jgi:GR25 family glycosyltransferase involved in LPS biosynthesis